MTELTQIYQRNLTNLTNSFENKLISLNTVVSHDMNDLKNSMNRVFLGMGITALILCFLNSFVLIILSKKAYVSRNQA